MMRKIILLVAVLLCLTGCKEEKTQSETDLTVILPSGKEVYLYMPKEDAVKILGEPDGEPMRGVFEYLDQGEELLQIGYTEGNVSSIVIKSSKCKIGQYQLGDKVDEFDGFMIDSKEWVSYGRVHEFKNNKKIESLDNFHRNKAAVGDYGELSLLTDMDGVIVAISIWDSKTAMILKYDRED